MNEKIKRIHENCVESANSFKKAQKDLISHLQAFDELKGFRELGYKNLHDYVTLELKLSADVAYTLITLARKSNEIPAFQEKIQSEEIGISNARMISPILTEKNQTEWLEKAESLTKRELEREIKREFPERAVTEKARYVEGNRLELKIGVDQELYEKIKRIQDLVSQNSRKAASLEDALQELATFYLEKKDPVKKAERVRKVVPVPEKPDPSLIGFSTPRHEMSQALKLFALNEIGPGALIQNAEKHVGFMCITFARYRRAVGISWKT